MPKLYIISGPNGAGKTTASYTILPEIINCNEFVNADEIAKGLSPFKPESVAIQAGRIMLGRINTLLDERETFAFETTLATKSYVRFVDGAILYGYEVVLLFLALDSVELAKNRVAIRVAEGGHNIPLDVIDRRYKSGLRNLFSVYMERVDSWLLVDNSKTQFSVIASSDLSGITVLDNSMWTHLKEHYGKK